MRTVKLLLVYVAAFSAAIVFTRCSSFKDDIEQIKESLNEFTVYMSSPKFDTFVHLEFVDAKTGEPIDHKDVSVSISGRDAAYVYDNIGSKQQVYLSKWGMLDLVIDPNKVDSVSMKSDPIQFNVTAELDGYISNTQSITIFDPTRNIVLVHMINSNNPPEGVTVMDDVLLGSTGANGFMNSLRLKGYSKASKFALDLPTNEYTVLLTEGAILKRADGKILNGEIRMSGYVNIYPRIISQPINSIQLYAQYGIWLFIGGQEVKSIENGILTVSIIVPTGTINDQTDSPIKEGDLMNNYELSGSSSVGPLKTETGLSVKNIKGVLMFENYRSTNFFGTFGIDYPMCIRRDKTEIIVKTDKIDYSTFEIRDDVVYRNRIVPSQFIGVWNNPRAQNRTNLNFNPEKGVVTHKFSMYNGNDPDKIYQFIPESIDVSGCDRKSYTVTIKETMNPAIEYITVNLIMSLRSETNTQLVVKPNGQIYLNNYAPNRNINYTVSQGKATLSVKKGVLYYISATVGSASGQGKLKVDGDSPTTYKVSFTSKINFGANTPPPSEMTVPITADKTISLNYEAFVPDDVFKKFR